MKKNKKVKIIVAVIVSVVVIAGLVAFSADIKTESLGTPVFCTSMDENGNYEGKAESFAGDVEQIIFACKNNKFYIREATITWYSDNDNIKLIGDHLILAVSTRER